MEIGIWFQSRLNRFYYPTAYIPSNCLFFCYVMSHWTFAQAVVLTNDWYYTMVWFPASLLKTWRHLSSCATMMRIQFVYTRRRFVTMVEMRHGLTTFNSYNFVAYGQKHKLWVLVFLVGTRWTLWDQIEQIRWNFMFCNKTASSTATPFKEGC